MLPGSFRSYFWMFLECEELSMGVISRGCWKGAFFLLGSWSFEALAFFCYVWNHFLIFVSTNARKLHFTLSDGKHCSLPMVV